MTIKGILRFKGMCFPYFLWYSPYFSKSMGPAAKNGFQIRIQHQYIQNIKEKRVVFYMPLYKNLDIT